MLRSPPARFMKLLDISQKAVPAQAAWPELHDLGPAISLACFTMLHQDSGVVSNRDKLLAAFMDTRPFGVIMSRAVIELRAKMEFLTIDLSAAAALILQDNLRDPSSTAQRVRAQLQEDLSDNAWLANWKS